MRDKKHVFKRGLSLFLALVMCLSLIQVTAFAEWEPEWDRLEHTNSADCQRCLHAAGDTYHTMEWKGTTRYCGCCGRIWKAGDGYEGNNFICKNDSSMHLWVEGTPLKATCTEDGHTAGEVCRYCGTTRHQEPIPATGHKSFEWKKDGTYHWKVCSNTNNGTVCATVFDKAAHSYGRDGKCVCGAVCEHDLEWHYSGDTDHGSEEHWQACKNCNYVTEHTRHQTADECQPIEKDNWKIWTCECGLVIQKTEITPEPCEHEWVFKDNEDGATHRCCCKKCGDVDADLSKELHQFAAGCDKCLKCGAVKPSEPVVQYTVTYYKSTDRNDVLETFMVNKGDSFVVEEAPATAPEGKVFDYWMKGTHTCNPGDQITPTGDVELFAKWKDAPAPEPETWTITYMNGDATFKTVKVEKGKSTATIAAPEAPEGKEFNGWWKGTTAYQPGDTIKPNGDWTLTAGWKTSETETPDPKTWTVTYQCGIFTREVPVIDGDETEVLVAFNVPAGKEFKHWECDGHPYQPGVMLKPAGDMTLTAVLVDKVTPSESVTYTLTYNANGEGVTGMPAEQTATSTEGSYTFTVAEAPAREGYTFKHWATTAEPVGTTLTYAAESEITLTADHNAQTLYAVWEEKTHEHSFTNYVPNGNATCVEDGTKTAKCDIDGCDATHTIADVGSAKGHIPGDAWTSDVSGHWHVCTVCEEKLETAEHTYTSETITIRDCNNGEAVRYTCTECQYSYTQTGSPFGHEVVSYANVAATCTANGYTGGSYCSRCGSVITARTVIPATGHSWGAGVVTAQPTYYSTGVRTYTCAHDASHTYTETIPALTYPGGGGGGYNPVTPVTPVTPNVPVTPNNPVTNIPDPAVPQGNTPGGATTIEDESTPLGGISFVDVLPTDWFYEAVQYVFEKGLMLGVSDTEFGPNLSTTRGMIVTILYRMEGEPEAAASPFTDVEPGLWYSDAIGWGAANDIVNGYGDGRFGPNDQITREQMAAIFFRYAQYKGYDVTARADLSGYADADQISPYAVEAMQWAVGVKLIGGMTADTLAPKGQATRAQVATMLMRFDKEIAAA